MAGADDGGTQRVSTSIPRSTVDWLRETYPDASSDGERLRHAISDARLLREHLGVEVHVDHSESE